MQAIEVTATNADSLINPKRSNSTSTKNAKIIDPTGAFFFESSQIK
jgi:hypothetical protein